MIEIIDVSRHFKPNWDKLKQQVREIERKEKMFPASGGSWGGWSVMSRTGSYKDGWAEGHRLLEQGVEASKLVGGFCSGDFTRYTDVATRELIFCCEQARVKKLLPSRARLTQLRPGDETDWHRDAPEENLFHRLHFVIETNENAIFKTGNDVHHLAERRTYLLNVNDWHSVHNFGPTPRTHLIMDIHSSDCRSILS